jgi:adenylate kinase
MLGAPGSGKGTYAKAIAQHLADLSPATGAAGTPSPLPILSTGDLIRDEIARDTDMGRAAKGASESGQLVSDDLVMSVVLSRLENMGACGFILDGFPRTIGQASALQAHNSGALGPTTVVNVDLAHDVITQKLMGRRVCAGCGTSYNVASVFDKERGYDMPAMPPPPACADTLTSRVDDTLEIIAARLDVYERETSPLIEFYKRQGLLVEFEVKRGMQDVPFLKRLIEQHQRTAT